jgi:hypothetical protein
MDKGAKKNADSVIKLPIAMRLNDNFPLLYILICTFYNMIITINFPAIGMNTLEQ